MIGILRIACLGLEQRSRRRCRRGEYRSNEVWSLQRSEQPRRFGILSARTARRVARPGHPRSFHVSRQLACFCRNPAVHVPYQIVVLASNNSVVSSSVLLRLLSLSCRLWSAGLPAAGLLVVRHGVAVGLQNLDPSRSLSCPPSVGGLVLECRPVT